MRKLIAVFPIAALVVLLASASTNAIGPEFRSLDGSGNNLVHNDWGQAGKPYSRVAPAQYADGFKGMQGGPPLRAVSNRVFNDLSQDLFSERGVSQMGWVWGQFIDHTLDLRNGSTTPAESPGIPFDNGDPLETFNNDLPIMFFGRTPGSNGPGTPVHPRDQENTVNSYISAHNVYGATNTRLDWIRQSASQDGNPTNNSARLLLPNNRLPRGDARGNASNAPAMELGGNLTGHPEKGVVAGDMRANENMALTAIQTVFAREHNRIVNALPAALDNETKFQIARRVVGAEQQYVTYNEFLPSMGVTLPAYTGYNPTVNSTISNEFATVGFRAHSQIHGEMEPAAPVGYWSAAQLDAFRTMGIEVEDEGDPVVLVVPLGLAFNNPDLLDAIGPGPLLQGLAAERQYKNDEQFDNQLRSILFQIPATPSADCFGTPDPNCFTVVNDLGAIDVARARDHGIPLYNAARAAYGLSPKTSFADVTGELTDEFPAGVGPNSESSLLFTQLRDESGNLVELGGGTAVQGLRGSTLAARLKAIYGNVDNMDVFVGMVAEKHVTGSELGELQLAMWKQQFLALRDGDRFFYGNDLFLDVIRTTYGIDYRKTLSQIIAANTDGAAQANAFEAPIAAGADTIGVVAAYSFDGNTADSSGWGNNGTTSSTVPVAGKYGQALSFNGSSSWVTVPDTGPLDLTSGLTLEAWVKPTALGTQWRTVVFKERPGGMIYSLYASQGTGHPLGQVVVGAERNVTGPGTLPLNTWSHLATTFDGTTQTLYVNGAPVATHAQTGPVQVSDSSFRIGGNSSFGEWFAGAIDEVRIYNRALAQPEIQADMTTPISAFQPRPPLAPALIGDTDVEPDSNPLVARGWAEASPSRVQADGSVAHVRVYVDAGTTATRLIAGVYDSNGAHPNHLLTAGALDAPVPGAWNTVTVPAAQVHGGDTIWIAVLGRGGRLGFRDQCCSLSSSVPTESNANTSLTALPVQWTTGNVYDDGPISAYGSG